MSTLSVTVGTDNITLHNLFSQSFLTVRYEVSYDFDLLRWVAVIEVHDIWRVLYATVHARYSLCFVDDLNTAFSTRLVASNELGFVLLVVLLLVDLVTVRLLSGV